MTDKQTCEGLDCAWCGALDCPREKKEIIVDGVDVSGCETYSKYRKNYCDWYVPCEGKACWYKINWALEQLKCKKEECELMETAIKIKDQRNEDYSKALANKSKENKELKNQIIVMNSEQEDFITETYNKVTNIRNKKDKYEQALDEIEKEIHSLGNLITIQNIINKAKRGK